MDRPHFKAAGVSEADSGAFPEESEALPMSKQLPCDLAEFIERCHVTAIIWHEEFDDDDNSIWTGASPFTTESDPDAAPNLYWRLKQRLVGNQIEWYADHDTELGGETGETWATIDDAKAATQAAHDHILISEC